MLRVEGLTFVPQPARLMSPLGRLMPAAFEKDELTFVHLTPKALNGQLTIKRTARAQ